jgi:hypothetical protein
LGVLIGICQRDGPGGLQGFDDVLKLEAGALKYPDGFGDLLFVGGRLVVGVGDLPDNKLGETVSGSATWSIAFGIPTLSGFFVRIGRVDDFHDFV